MTNFLIVGTPKAGTTALHNYLRQHNEIFMPAKKEIHFFGSEFKFGKTRYRKRMTANEYTSFFKDSKNSQIKGETSVFYLYSKDAFLEIKEYNENMKIIIMLRHPVDFLISYHQDALYVGIENEPDFWKALDLEKNRKQGLNIPITNNFEKGLYYSELIDYATHIEKFMKTFKNNVKVVLFEEFFSNPTEGYKEVLSFLEVKNNDFKLENFEIINKRRSVKSKKLNALIFKPNRVFRILLRMIFPSEELRLKIFKGVRKLNTSHQQINDLNMEEKTKLQASYLHQIIILEKLLNRNLDIWKNKYV
ncbi:MAG: sulfotransferase domain-containing protein [Flavobacteriales bacterium]|nr:sulfotransferase domain-containing protein [Flavobacteriales bacterium]